MESLEDSMHSVMDFVSVDDEGNQNVMIQYDPQEAECLAVQLHQSSCTEGHCLEALPLLDPGCHILPLAIHVALVLKSHRHASWTTYVYVECVIAYDAFHPILHNALVAIFGDVFGAFSYDDRGGFDVDVAVVLSVGRHRLFLFFSSPPLSSPRSSSPP